MDINLKRFHHLITFSTRLCICLVLISSVHIQHIGLTSPDQRSENNQLSLALSQSTKLSIDTDMNTNTSRWYDRSLPSLIRLDIGITSAWSIPPRSMSLQKSGEAQVGSPMPWFSGWDLTEHPVNLNMILNQNKKGYILMLCATWCVACKEGMRMLISARHQLQIEDIQILLAFSEDINLSHLTTWLNEQIPPQVTDRLRNLNQKSKRKTKKKKRKSKRQDLLKNSNHMNQNASTPMLSPWRNLLVFQDRYLAIAKRLGAYKEDETQTEQRLDLPRVVVFDQQGIVVDIIHQEGYDFLDRVKLSLN